MKILRYWLDCEILPGIRFNIVPEQIRKSDEGFFDQIVDAVRLSGFPYTLTEQTESLIEKRAPPKEPSNAD